MDNFNSNNIGPSEDRNAPIPFDDDTSDASVSHSPLNIGGSGTAEVPKIQAAEPIAKKPAETIVSTERITGVKTFFTKLHAGSLDFLDEQIANWLKTNPGITIKRTNTVTGTVAGKKSEPNIIVTIWY
ncbi:MAG: hypothetical protein ACYS0C_06955 [Planctomycetota bacterium]|jgi:hypothetical protein